jgi:hypothetical protein
MGYTVRIMNNITREIRTSDHYNFEFQDYWWEDGNMSCDCNREMVWFRCLDKRSNFNHIDIPCSEHLYSVLDAKLDNGIIIKIDDEIPPPPKRINK